MSGGWLAQTILKQTTSAYSGLIVLTCCGSSATENTIMASGPQSITLTQNPFFRIMGEASHIIFLNYRRLNQVARYVYRTRLASRTPPQMIIIVGCAVSSVLRR